MSSFISTTMKSKNKSFNEDKIFKKKSTINNIFVNKSLNKKKKSISKPIILKMKSIKKINPIIKEDFPMKKCQNIFSYAQKMEFNTEKKETKSQ